MAEATEKTRNSQWKSYMDFCLEFGILEPLPATLEVILLYLTHLADRLCYSSITQYLSAVWILHKTLGLSHVDPKNFEIYMTLRGIRRVLGDTVTQARPASIQDLVAIYRLLDMSSSEDVAFWVAIVLCFRGLLRKSNVVEPGLAVTVFDMDIENWGLAIRLRRTKTISFKERVLYIPFVRIPGSIFCVLYYVSLLLSMLLLPSRTCQLVGFMRNGRWVRGSYSWYLSKLKSLCVRSGLDPMTTHSLRRGGASLLADSGFSLLDIKNVGDWKSLSVLNYLTKTKQSRMDLDRRVVATVFSV